MKKRHQKILLILCLALLSFFLCANLASFITYQSLFKRYDGNDSFERFNTDEFDGYKNMQKYTYKSKNTTLCGYHFNNNTSYPIIVISSGLNSESSEMYAICDYFYEHNYNVFIYDNSGCGESEGKQYGFYQSLIDLEYTLDFLNTENEFKNYKKMLFGHSMGGYATTSIFNQTDKNILASVSVSGFNNAGQIMKNKGKDYVGFLSYFGVASINILQNKYFKDYLSYTAVSGINNTNTPIYLAHGKNDKVIDYVSESIISANKLFINPLVRYDVYDCDHTVILFSKNNSFKYINLELFEKVVSFYGLYA